LMSSMSLRYSALELKKMHGNPPDVRQYIAHSENELRIQAFNSVCHIPQGFSSDKDAADWIANNPELNPGQVVKFLTSPTAVLILGAIASQICGKGSQSFIERFQHYLETTGAVTLISEVDSMPNTLSVVLDEYAKAVCIKQYGDGAQQEDVDAVRQLCRCILSLNQAILNGNEASTLPQFFSAVRSFSNKAVGLLAPKQLTDIYNSLRNNGPIVYTSNSDIFPSFLFCSPSWRVHCSVSLHGFDGVCRPRWCVLTADALHVFVEEASPWPSECLPLGWLRCIRSERGEGMCLELQSRCGNDPMIPLVHVGAGAASSLSYHSCVLLKFATAAECEESLPFLEKAIWKSNKLVSS
jgi:hypothetical protein